MARNFMEFSGGDCLAGYDPDMNFATKLGRLQMEYHRWQSYLQLERDIGAPEKSLDRYVRENRLPPLDYGLRLARALHVPAEWLFDDSQGWPPPPPLMVANDPAWQEQILSTIMLAAREGITSLQRANSQERAGAGRGQSQK